MRINSDQLKTHLQKPLQPVYWIAGDETLIVQETLDLLRARCRKDGFSEWDLFFVERGFQWQSMLQSANNMSLFSDKKIIELRLYSPKLEDGGRDALQEYITSPDPNNILIIVSPRLEASALNSKWFKSIEAAGAFVQIWPVDSKSLPRWITTRLASHGLSADAEAVALLADKVEGNLLAANQEIEKLSVLTGASPDNKIHIDRKHILTLVADSSRYNVFNLLDAALLGDGRRTLKILNGLRSEGSEPLGILAMVCREVRTLIAIHNRIANGQNTGSAMQNEGVRRNHEGPVSKAIERSRIVPLTAMLQRARLIDMAVKGLAKADPWVELTTLLLSISGNHLSIAELQSDFR